MAAARKKTTTKAGENGQKGAVATLPADKAKGKKKEESLPKGQSRAKDGTIILKNGEHKDLPKATYEVHGARLQFEGSVFIAQQDVIWLPVKKCVCKTDRPSPMEIKKLPSGHWAAFATCANKKCQYCGLTYVWIMSPDTFRV